MNVTAPEKFNLQPSGLKLRQQRLEVVIKVFLAVIAASCVLITTGVVVALVRPTIDFFREVGITEFLFTTDWFPLYEPPDFGVWPLVVGTFTVMLIAVIIAVPGGLFVAFFLSEYASPRTKRYLKPFLEILAGVPTVVFGFFALNFVAPNIARKIWVFSDVGFYSALAAGITVGLMILPMMTTLAEDAMAAVPRSLIDGAYALGATKWAMIKTVAIPYGYSGVVGGAMLGLGRAMGETVAVFTVLNIVYRANFDILLGAGGNLASHIILKFGEASSEEIKALMAAGFVLFLLTLAVNLLADFIVARTGKRGK